MLRHLFLTKAQNHRGRHSTPFADTASMNSRDSSSPASFNSKIRYRRPQFRQLVQGARLGSSFHGINALRSNSDICSCTCKELSFLELAVGFVVNYKHSATIPSGNAIFQQLAARLAPIRFQRRVLGWPCNAFLVLLAEMCESRAERGA
jgi:hypothetical protein